MTENLVLSESFAPDLMNKIEETAVSAAREILTGRRIIDVEGPYGLGMTTVEVGNDDLCRQPGPNEASAVLSRALSLPMIYRRFSISKRRIAAFQEMGQPLHLKMVEALCKEEIGAASIKSWKTSSQQSTFSTAKVTADPTGWLWRRRSTTICFDVIPALTFCRSSI